MLKRAIFTMVQLKKLNFSSQVYVSMTFQYKITPKLSSTQMIPPKGRLLFPQTMKIFDQCPFSVVSGVRRTKATTSVLVFLRKNFNFFFSLRYYTICSYLTFIWLYSNGSLSNSLRWLKATATEDLLFTTQEKNNRLREK